MSSLTIKKNDIFLLLMKTSFFPDCCRIRDIRGTIQLEKVQRHGVNSNTALLHVVTDDFIITALERQVCCILFTYTYILQ